MDVMVTGDSPPGADRKGIDLPWVFVLNTACVPDVPGLRTRYPDAEPVKVLLGRARESIRVLIFLGTWVTLHDFALYPFDSQAYTEWHGHTV